MSATKFRIPDTDLYLSEDGTFSPIVESGEAVLELTSENAELLHVVYHGQALKQLKFLSNSSTAHGDNKDPGMEVFKEGLEWFSLGIDFIEFAEKLNHWITGAHDAPDPVMESLKAVHEKLNKIYDFNLAAWVTSREENLAFLMAHSATSIQTANAFIQSKASRTDPVWAAKIAIAERDSLLAVNTFSDVERGYWLRPDSLAAISWAGDPTSAYTGWMHHIPDRAEVNQFKQVWDYRWAQPAFLYTILARLIVLKAFETGTTAERRLYCQEIEGYRKRLGKVFSKRWSGIRTLEKLSDLQRNVYLHTGRIPMVAVDIYGGDYLGGYFFNSNFKESFFPPGIAAPGMDSYLHPSRPFDLIWVENNMRAFARHWWNLLYLRTGLEDLLLFISELDAICDKPWFSSVFSDVQRKVRLVKTDDKARKDALVAAALSDFLPAGDEAANASRTHYLYEALNGNSDEAQKIIANSVRELYNLVENEYVTRKMERTVS